MEITHKINNEFILICKEILRENLDLKEWNLIESCDQFQTENYCGGFEGIEDEFTFSFFNKNREEFWFQITLSDIEKVEKGIIKEIAIRKAE
ncbi:hypothetical protein BW723_14550 [Polaribacter reichenbachii]|uniref:Uncharacterized protein n=1 Tax=Polaribacter reichenbachii TaxID=996801 RepID=A0A1B8U4B2_9FLAO|nr:hypothetical protein [Polaribacter reichenbachii]APZ47430.1 hypothetical protein BW723_14550 [Polaribacter reichenbachii]AUC18068.1 hypothetical protein BTO17_04990 [Polaribacter reichenbachii]OBY66679.1 hypothetical protein LPB301_05620 [Polaribacter reichenbachii]